MQHTGDSSASVGGRSRTCYEREAHIILPGPDAVSINSLAAVPLYAHLEKGESYRFPAHDNIVSVFLKQDSKEVHRERRRVWGGLFTPTRYAARIPAQAPQTPQPCFAVSPKSPQWWKGGPGSSCGVLNNVKLRATGTLT